MLAFVHIPKTAGTTLHKILAHQYRKTLIHHDTDGPMDELLAARIRSENPQIMMGHFSVGIHALIPETRYITCLRDPVSRIFSHYHHALNDRTHYLHNAVVSQHMSPADYVASGLSGELANGMTRMIAGVQDFHHAVVDEQTLALAKFNIENLFDGVILSESFDSGILQLSEKLDWNPPYYIRRKVGHYISDARRPNDLTRKVIEEHNRFDCELHAWIKNRSEILEAASPELIKRSFRFKQTNRKLGKVVFCVREVKLRLRQMCRTT